MNNSTNNTAYTIQDLFKRTPWAEVMEAYSKYGYHSLEFKEAELALQKHLAKSNAEYQIRKADNQARLYEEGY